MDEGAYHCSIRTMYRILDDHGEVCERRDQLRHPNYKKPELLATGPNQVWSWDITKLLGPAKWTYYYLYMILDIYSRYAVGWMLASRENADLAKRLIRDSVEQECVDPDELTLHSDRGPSMKSHGVAQLLATLGVTKSHSRPHVSNDNPFSESQFKTLKYRPEFPDRFGSQEDAHAFCERFFRWYNHEHYHSGIGLLTPAMVHYGHAPQILASRQKTLLGPSRPIASGSSASRPRRCRCPRPSGSTRRRKRSPDDEKGLPQPVGSRKPDAPSAHPRPGYPSSGCVPAELDSVSPDPVMISQSGSTTTTLGHPSHA